MPFSLKIYVQITFSEYSNGLFIWKLPSGILWVSIRKNWKENGGKICQEYLKIKSKKIVQFSHSVMSDSLQPHGLQHAKLTCPASTSGACSLMSIESVITNCYHKTKLAFTQGCTGQLRWPWSQLFLLLPHTLFWINLNHIE